MFCARGFFGSATGGGNPQSFGTVVADGAASATASLDSAGNVSGSGGGAGYWFAPVQTGIGAGYWLRCTRQSGSVPGGASSNGSTWVSLASTRSWTLSAALNSFKSCVLQIDIAADAAGVSIVASGTLTILADNSNQ